MPRAEHERHLIADAVRGAVLPSEALLVCAIQLHDPFPRLVDGHHHGYGVWIPITRAGHHIPQGDLWTEFEEF